jgi:hypothetical protein
MDRSMMPRRIGYLGIGAAIVALLGLTAAYVPGEPTPQPNLLINATTEIDQANEGAAIASSGGSLNAYVVDGFKVALNSTAATKAAVSCQRASDAPTGYAYSLKCTVTTAASSVAGGDYLIVALPIEADTIQDALLGTASAQSLCRQWQVKSSVGSYIYGWALQNFAQTRSFPNAETIAGANSWTAFSSCFAGDTGGSWVTSGSGGGALLIVAVAAGSSFQGTGASWAGADTFATAAATNSILTTTSATFEITNAKLEISPLPTPFRRVGMQQELARCQRYYEKSWNLGTALATVTRVGDDGLYVQASATSTLALYPRFKVAKRATPTMTVYSPNSGASGNAWNINVGDVGASAANVALGGFEVGVSTSALAPNNVVEVHWTADARL